ncbi:MAG TPA: HAD domain-containing protein [Solirubrobacterales bacterium]|nr:HAD domain-containing protein [Solirubrobacterales bacterium]
MERPILAVDVDGVISLFGSETKPDRAQTQLQLVDGVPHLISLAAGDRLRRLCSSFEMVWASGWEDKANFYLPSLLGLAECPHIGFDRAARPGGAHWKLGALDEYARGRAVAWVDDNFDESCHAWAERRPEPTLLVPTEPHLGLEEAHVAALESWAAELD